MDADLIENYVQVSSPFFTGSVSTGRFFSWCFHLAALASRVVHETCRRCRVGAWFRRVVVTELIENRDEDKVLSRKLFGSRDMELLV